MQRLEKVRRHSEFLSNFSVPQANPTHTVKTCRCTRCARGVPCCAACLAQCSASSDGESGARSLLEPAVLELEPEPELEPELGGLGSVAGEAAGCAGQTERRQTLSAASIAGADGDRDGRADAQDCDRARPQNRA